MGRKSTRENKTIYQKLREEDQLTREKAAELLEFISEDRMERIDIAPANVLLGRNMCLLWK